MFGKPALIAVVNKDEKIKNKNKNNARLSLTSKSIRPDSAKKNTNKEIGTTKNK